MLLVQDSFQVPGSVLKPLYRYARIMETKDPVKAPPSTLKHLSSPCLASWLALLCAEPADPAPFPAEPAKTLLKFGTAMRQGEVAC